MKSEYRCSGLGGSIAGAYRVRSAGAGAVFTILMICLGLLGSCGPGQQPGPLPVADLTPPLVVSAAPEGERVFALDFSEDIIPVEGSCFLEPGPQKAEVRAEGRKLELAFSVPFLPGAEYRVAGEVEDARGNSTRFVFQFIGWNAHPASLRISELQAGKNSSKTNPHRDYVEFVVAGAGNTGGLELAWSSTVKTCRYSFPAVEVRAGDYLVLHLAPEGMVAEADETGADISLSGGVDANANGRDFWSAEGGLPDESGALCLSDRPGGGIQDFLFYRHEDKSGVMKEDRLSAFLADAGTMPGISSPPVWEDGFGWKPSTARSIARKILTGSGGKPCMDALAWYVCEAGSQTPGKGNLPPGTEAARSPKRTKSVSGSGASKK